MSLVPVCREKYYEILKKKMEEKPVFVVSSNQCPYWVKAKNVLDDNNVDATEFNMDNYTDEEKMEFGHCIYGGLPRRFVPFIFVEGQPLGSYSELMEAQKNGVLSKFATNQGNDIL